MRRQGAVTAAGRIDDVLTADNLSLCFDLDVSLERREGRWFAWAR